MCGARHCEEMTKDEIHIKKDERQRIRAKKICEIVLPGINGCSLV